MPSSQSREDGAAAAAGNITPRIPVNSSVLNPRIQESPRTKRFCPCPAVCAANPATLTGPCASNPATLTDQVVAGLPPSGQPASGGAPVEQHAAAAMPTPRKSRWFRRPFSSSKASHLESPRGSQPVLVSPRPEPPAPPATAVPPAASPTGAIPVGVISNQASVRYQAAHNATVPPSQGVGYTAPVPAASTTTPPDHGFTPSAGPVPAPIPVAAPTHTPARVGPMAVAPTGPPSGSSAQNPVPPAPTSYQLGPAAVPEDELAPLSEEIGQLQQQLQLLSTSLNQLASSHSAPSSNQPGVFPPVSEDNMSALMRQLNSLNASIIRLGQGQAPEKKLTTGKTQSQSKVPSGSLSAREDVSSPRPPLPPQSTSTQHDLGQLRTAESLQSSRAGSLTSQHLHQTMSQPGQAVPLTGRMSSGSGSTSGGRSRLAAATLSSKVPSTGPAGTSGAEKAAGESDYVDIGGQLSRVMHQLESMKSGDATAKTGSFPDRNLSSDYMERLPGWKSELDSIQQELADYYQGPPGTGSHPSNRRRQRRPEPQPAGADQAVTSPTEKDAEALPSRRVAVGAHSAKGGSQQDQRATPSAPYMQGGPSSSGQARMMDNPGCVSKPLLNSGGNASDWNSSTLSVDSSSAPITPLSLPGAGHNPDLTTLDADDSGRFGEDGRRGGARRSSSRPSGHSASIGLGHQVPADDMSPFEQAEMEAAKVDPGRNPATWTDDTVAIQDGGARDQQRQGGTDAWAPCFVTASQAAPAGGAAAAAQRQGKSGAAALAGDLGLLNLDTANSSFLQEAAAQSAGDRKAAESEFLVTADSNLQEQQQQNNLLTMSSATESWVMRFKDGGGKGETAKPTLSGRVSAGASEDGSHGSMSDAGRRINSIDAHLQDLQAGGASPHTKGSDSDRDEVARLLLQGGSVSDVQAAADLAWASGLRRAARSGARRRASAPSHGGAVVMQGGKPRFTRVRPPTQLLSSDAPTLGSRRMFLTGGSTGGGVSSGERSTSQVIDGRRRKRHGSTDSCDINDGAVSSCVNSVEVDDLVPDSPGQGAVYLPSAGMAGAGIAAIRPMGDLASPGSDAPIMPGMLSPNVHRTSIGTSPGHGGMRSRPMYLGAKQGTATAERTSAGGSSTMSSQSSYPAELSLPSSQPSAGPGSSDHLFLSPTILSDGAPSAKSKSDASAGSVGHAGGKSSPTDPGMALPTLLSASSSEGSYQDNSPKAQAGSPVNTAEITAQLEQLVVDAAVVRKRTRRLSKCSPRSTGGHYPFAPDSPMNPGNAKLSTWSHNQWGADIRSGGTSASVDNLFGNRAESPARVTGVQTPRPLPQGSWGTRSTDSLTSMPWMVGRKRFVTRRTGSSSSHNSPSHRTLRQGLGLGSERSSQESAEIQAWPGDSAAAAVPAPDVTPAPNTVMQRDTNQGGGLRNVANVARVPGGNTTAYFMSAAPTQADMDVLVRLEKGDLKHPSKTGTQGKAAQLQDTQQSDQDKLLRLLGVAAAAPTAEAHDQSHEAVSKVLTDHVEPAAAITQPVAISMMDAARPAVPADLETGDTYDTGYDMQATQSVADSADTAFTATDAGARGLLHADTPMQRLSEAAENVSEAAVETPVLATPEKRAASPDSVRLAASFYQRVSPASTHSQTTPGALSPGVNAAAPSPPPAPGLRSTLASTSGASQIQTTQSSQDMVPTPIKMTPIKALTAAPSPPSTSLYSTGVSTPPRMGFTPKSPLLDSAERTPLTSPHQQRIWITSPNITAPPPSPELTPSGKHHPREASGPTQSDITRAISSMIRSRTGSIYGTPGDETPPRKAVSRALAMSVEEPEVGRTTQTAVAVLAAPQPRPGSALRQLAAQFDASSGEPDLEYPPGHAAAQKRAEAHERPTSPDFIPSCSSFNKPHLQPGAFQAIAQQPARAQPAAFGWDSMLAHPPQLAMMPTGQQAQQRVPSRPFAMAPLMAFAQPLSPVSTNTTFTVDSSVVESPMQPVRPSMQAALHSATDPEPSRSSLASGSEAWMSTRGLDSGTMVDTTTGSLSASRRHISFAGRNMGSSGSNSRFSSTHSDLQSSTIMDSAVLTSGEAVLRGGTLKNAPKQSSMSAQRSPAQGVAEAVEGLDVNAAWAGILMPQRPGVSDAGGPPSMTHGSVRIKGAKECVSPQESRAFSAPDVVLQVPVYEGPELDMMRSSDSVRSRQSLVFSPKSTASDTQGSARQNTPRTEVGGVASIAAGTPPRPQTQLLSQHTELTTPVTGKGPHQQSMATPAAPASSDAASLMMSTGGAVATPSPAVSGQPQVRPPPSPGRIPPTPRSTASHSSTPSQQGLDPRVQTPSSATTTPRTVLHSGPNSNTRCPSPSRSMQSPRRSGEPSQAQPGSPTASRRGRGTIKSTSSDEGGRRLNFEWWQRPEVDRQISRSPSPAPRRTHSQSSQEEDVLHSSRRKRDRSARKLRQNSRDQIALNGSGLNGPSSSESSDAPAPGHSSRDSPSGGTTEMMRTISGPNSGDHVAGKLGLMSSQSGSHYEAGNIEDSSALLSTGDQTVPYTPGTRRAPGNDKSGMNNYSNFVNAVYDMSPRVNSHEAGSVGAPSTPPQLCSAGAGEYTTGPQQQQAGPAGTPPSSLLSRGSSTVSTHQQDTSPPGMTTYNNSSYPHSISTASPDHLRSLHDGTAGTVMDVTSPTSPVPPSTVSDMDTAPVHNLNLTLDAKFLALDPEQQEALTTAERNEHGKVLAQQLKAIMDALGQPCGSPTSGSVPFETLQGLLTGASLPEGLRSMQSAVRESSEGNQSPLHSLDAEKLQALLASMATSLDGLKDQTGLALDSATNFGDQQALNSDELTAAVLRHANISNSEVSAHKKPAVPSLRKPDPNTSISGGVRGSAGTHTSAASSSPAPSNSPPLSGRYQRHRPHLQSDQSEITSGDSGRSGSRGRLVSFMDSNVPGACSPTAIQHPANSVAHNVAGVSPVSARAANKGSSLSFARSWSTGGSVPGSPAGESNRAPVRLGLPTTSDGTVQVTPNVVVYKTTPRNARSVERQRPGGGKRDNKCTVQ